MEAGNHRAAVRFHWLIPWWIFRSRDLAEAQSHQFYQAIGLEEADNRDHDWCIHTMTVSRSYGFCVERWGFLRWIEVSGSTSDTSSLEPRLVQDSAHELKRADINIDHLKEARRDVHTCNGAGYESRTQPWTSAPKFYYHDIRDRSARLTPSRSRKPASEPDSLPAWVATTSVSFRDRKTQTWDLQHFPTFVKQIFLTDRRATFRERNTSCKCNSGLSYTNGAIAKL